MCMLKLVPKDIVKGHSLTTMFSKTMPTMYSVYFAPKGKASIGQRLKDTAHWWRGYAT